ncbi:BrnT family toxin [Nitrosomonas sp. Nm34]|uniref:BrnT family toxin n=1 Tax=Nitrosomonas sp. Nm34 TaxID=1881055 RepID=UPI0008F11B2B|nr:BrnT family toxin [Nitrosomonas sp. Nm34]SFI74676.1 hypothetical protein SAMN05428978_103212 [Nitrosomonas sp. Nm34]
MGRDQAASGLEETWVDFADAELVFAGYTLTRQDKRFAYDEFRFPTIGLLGVEVMVIAHTETVDEIRIISMRKAERYEQENNFASL